MKFFRQVFTILERDLRVELRSKDTLVVMLFFAFLLVIVINFCIQNMRDIDLADVRLERDVNNFPKANILPFVPAILWTTFLFSSTLGLSRSMARERENGALFGLFLSPIDPLALYLGKILSQVLFLTIVQVFVIATTEIFTDVPLLANLGWLLLVTVIVSIGFTSVGTALAAITSSVKRQDVLLPVILFPLMIPILMASTEFTAGVIMLNFGGNTFNWLYLLIFVNVILLSLGGLLFERVLEE
ncbi:MAG: heme exporter protein CcmB [Planctomycetes bacterium]|nr:heme exporter protein CcmB [Planctomycetota bacterium]